ncbi:hypothetical protein CHH59_20620 [Shouchella clausii]|nr:hypothetical protein DB29_00182 [Shouchella clausii]KKI85670.1 hypothetical protein WZ76_14105 [Shouchella clausii]PAD48583.1 hypothetical protein CHI09_01020 [Shouchella clausii]PAE95667.1 hypothetical protein CHH70_03760 [Shouchella clausii]PAF11009.1 hypothetical protein CHH65_02315 [Shouchella clausii]
MSLLTEQEDRIQKLISRQSTENGVDDQVLCFFALFELYLIRALMSTTRSIDQQVDVMNVKQGSKVLAFFIFQ